MGLGLGSGCECDGAHLWAVADGDGLRGEKLDDLLGRGRLVRGRGRGGGGAGIRVGVAG